MSTGFPTSLDSSRAVGDAVAQIEAVIGVTASTDPTSLTYQLNAVTPALKHRSDVTAYVTTPVGDTVPSNGLTAGTIYAIPFYVPATNTYAHLGVIRTVVVANASERLGVYLDAGGIPGDLVQDWGFIPATTTTGFKTITPPNPVSLTGPSWVWLACCPQTAVNTLVCTVGTATGSPVVVATTTPHTSGVTMGYAGATGQTGALPSTWGSTYTERAVVPMLYIARV